MDEVVIDCGQVVGGHSLAEGRRGRHQDFGMRGGVRRGYESGWSKDAGLLWGASCGGVICGGIGSWEIVCVFLFCLLFGGGI